MPEFLCLTLVNSAWDSDRKGSARERLTSPEALERLAAAAGLTVTEPATPAELDRMKALREELRQLIREVAAGQTDLESLLAPLNAAMAGWPSVKRLVYSDGCFCIAQTHQATGWEALHLAVIDSLFVLLTEYDPARLRVCENPQCGWTFYDETRNGTHRCCDETCRDRLRVQRFRARRRAQSEA